MTPKPKPIAIILVTGAGGQLGSEIKTLVQDNWQQWLAYQFIFCESKDLDITKATQITDYFHKHQITHVINCAAYTKVDLAESEPEKAQSVNYQGVVNLANACKQHKSTLIHISTDFVFGGNKNKPYKETDPTQPIGSYAQSKWAGERAALSVHNKTILIRTSWVYSSFGHNFVKTMLRLGQSRPQIGVVYDQIGSPTYARDLAQAILHIVEQPTETLPFGEIFHYCNQGVVSWYDLAVATMQLAQLNCLVHPIETKDYPTPAKRPAYSVLHTQKIKQQFNLSIPHWRESLEKCLHLIEN